MSNKPERIIWRKNNMDAKHKYVILQVLPANLEKDGAREGVGYKKMVLEINYLARTGASCCGWDSRSWSGSTPPEFHRHSRR